MAQFFGGQRNQSQKILLQILLQKGYGFGKVACLEPARLIFTNIGDFAYFQELLSGPFVTRRIFLVNYVKYGGIAENNI